MTNPVRAEQDDITVYDLSEKIRQKIYDLWVNSRKSSRTDFGQASFQSFVRQAIFDELVAFRAAYRTTATAPTTDFAEKFTVECELEDNGQWLAEVMQANGAMAYGQQPSEAIRKALEIARIERYEPAAPVPLPEPQLANRVSEWISVEERLPERGPIVLIYTNEGHIETAWLRVDGELEWMLERTAPQDEPITFRHRDGQVTHWQPLPSPPTVPLVEEKK